MSAGEAMSTAGDSQPDSNKLESVIQVRGRGELPQSGRHHRGDFRPVSWSLEDSLELLLLEWLLVNYVTWFITLRWLLHGNMEIILVFFKILT